MAVEVLRLREGVQLDQLQELIATFVDMKGCPACGLNGFDIRLEIDPRIRHRALTEKFQDVLTEIVVRPLDVDQIEVLGRQVVR
jgi:hypothetical protein